MKKINDFFGKFNNKAVEEILKREKISSVIKKIANISIDIKDINISNGEIKLKISSIEKSEIFIKKKKILDTIKEELKGLRIIDIK